MAPRADAFDRRQFLALASTLIAGHRSLFARNSPPMQDAGSGVAPRLVALELLTEATLSDLERFYAGTLGLPIVARGERRLTIAAGSTQLTFVAAPAKSGHPFYHFAFNIPENKIVDALTWQKERSPLLPIPERLRDPKYPPEVVDYRHWNAHSIFFLDPGGNVVEYIARHDLKNAAGGVFSARDILYASEIAFIVDDVTAAATTLKRVVGVDQYRGGDGNFTALGDEEGLLLVMKRGRILNFQPQSDEKAARVFSTGARVRGRRPAESPDPFPGFPYTLTVE
jgi:hypothetical protein